MRRLDWHTGLGRAIEQLFARRAPPYFQPLRHWERGWPSEYHSIRVQLEQRARRPIRWEKAMFAAECTGRTVREGFVRGCGREFTTGLEMVLGHHDDEQQFELACEHSFAHSVLYEYHEPSTEGDVWLMLAERVAPAILVHDWPLIDLIYEVPQPVWLLEPWHDLARYQHRPKMIAV